MKYKTPKSRRSLLKSYQAPTGGLNDKDSISNMGEEYALNLDNIFTESSFVSVRGGSVAHVTGLPATGETLMAYNGISAKKMFAAVTTAIYDVTSAGVVGAAVVTGKTNARWDTVNFGGAGSNFLVAVNAADLPMFYNGSTWTPSGTGYASAITGVNASLFSQVSVWKNRLFFVEKNTLNAWYLGALAIGGAALALDFAGVAKLGGFLVAILNISSSAGTTIDDYLCAITSEGEALLYQGTDPASASTFALVGNYFIGRPMANADNRGGRWLAKLSSNVFALTADGLTPLQEALFSNVVAENRQISDNILNQVGSDTFTYRANFGWKVVVCPFQNKLIINVPSTELVASHQYVMSTISKKWSKFTGWDAVDIISFNDKIYGIIGTKVYELDVPKSNDLVSGVSPGVAVSGIIKSSFRFPGSSVEKNYKFIRPIFISSGQINPAIGINVNLRDEQVDSNADIITDSTFSLWGVAQWGVNVWSSDEITFQDWIKVNGSGNSIALKMTISANNQSFKFLGWDLIFENGGLI